MRLIWTFLLFILLFSAWMLLTPYSAGGSFDWQMAGVFKGLVSDEKASFFYLMGDQSILRLTENYAVDATGTAGAEGAWRIVGSGQNDQVWHIWKQSAYAGAFKGEGIPFLKGGRLFFISSDNTILKEISLEAGKVGRLLWEKTLPSSLVSLGATSQFLALGLSMGEVWLLDTAGNLSASFNYADKADSLVTGVALAKYNAKTYLALTEGWDQTRWHVYEWRESGVWSELATGDAEKNLGREVNLIFDANEPLLFIEKEQGVIIYSLKSGKVDTISSEGILIKAFSSSLGTNYILSFNPQKQEIIFSQTLNSEILSTWRWKSPNFIQWALGSSEALWLDPKTESTAWLLKRASL